MIWKVFLELEASLWAAGEEDRTILEEDGQNEPQLDGPGALWRTLRSETLCLASLSFFQGLGIINLENSYYPSSSTYRHHRRRVVRPPAVQRQGTPSPLARPLGAE